MVGHSIRTPAIMVSLFLCSWLGIATPALAQTDGGATLKTFQIYIDRDANPNSGLDAVMNDGVSIAAGVELLLTVTVNAGPTPMVVLVEAQQWDGNNSFNPAYFTDGSGWPVGTNNGTSASDVIEAYMPLDRLGITQNVNFFIQSGQPGNFDIAGPTPFMFGVPIPTLSQWALYTFILLFLVTGLWYMRRSRTSKTKGLLALFAATMLFGTTCLIVLDGQIGDWSDPPIATDPVNDAGEDAIDILAVFTCYDHQNLFLRLDVEELENQSPVAIDSAVSLFEDNSQVVSLTATDVNGDQLLFAIQSAPSNGGLGAVTSTGLDTADVTYTPNDDFNGSDSFTFLVDDQNGGTAIGTVTLTIDPVNDAPSFTAGAPPSVSKDTGPQTFPNWATAISPGPIDEAGQNFSFQVNVISNPGVFAVQPAIDAATGTLTFTPDVDNNGPADIEITLMDDGGTANGGLDTSAPQTVTITIGAVNDAPSFTAGTNQTNNEDDGAITVNAWATAMSPGPPDEAGQLLTFNSNITSDPGSIFSVPPAIDAASGDLTYTLAADAFGVATVDVTLMDDGGTANGGVDTSAPQTLTITVNPINDAPSFTNAGTVNVFKGGGTETIPAWASALVAGPANESTQGFVAFTVMVTSDPNNVLGNTPSVDTITGNLVFDTTADNNGTATISVTLQDDGGTANGGVDSSAAAIIDIIVGAVNDAPSFTAGMDQIHNEDDGAIAVNAWATAMSPGPPDEAGQMLTFNANITSDPGSIFSVAPAIDAASGNLTYTLATNAFGVATVEVTLMDDGGTANGGVDTSAPHTLTITVNPVNDAPSFANGGNVDVFKGGSPQTIAGWASSTSVGPANESSQSLTGYTVMITSDVNGVLNGTPTVYLATGDLQFTTTADNNGTATISVTLMDDGGTANGGVDTSAAAVININVQAVNDPPSFTAGPNITVDEDSGPQSFAGWATGMSPGPPDEAGQILTFNITGNTNAPLFSTPPAVDATTGTLTFETAPGAHTGMPATPATITLELMDDGGTANGGLDTSPPQMFTITVNPVNMPPVANDDSYDAAVHTLLEVGVSTAASGHEIAGSVLTDGTADNDPDAINPLIVTGTSNVTPGAVVTINSDGTFTLLPPPNTTTGTVSFDYTISDQDPFMPLTDTATVTVTLFDPVWYVKNDHPGPSQGTSENPFQTLAEAETASGVNDKIFVFTGDGTTTGQNAGITLKNGQALIGERVDLVLDINGSMSTIVTGSGMASSAPNLGNVGGDVVTLADDNIVRGLTLLPTASAGVIGVSSVGMKRSSTKIQKYRDRVGSEKRAGGTTVVSDVLISPAGTSDGLYLLGQTGNFSFTNSEITGLAGNTGAGLIVDSSTAAFTFDNLGISNVGEGVSLFGNNAPGGINFSNTHISACSNLGVRITSENNPVTFASNCSINQLTGGGGIDISNTSQTHNFDCAITANNVSSSNDGIRISSLEPIVNFAAVTLDTSNGGRHGVLLQNLGAMSDINFNGVLDINGAEANALFMLEVRGTVDITQATSDLANAKQNGVEINQGAPTFTCNATITNHAQAILFEGITGGATNFNGTVTHGTSPHALVVVNGLSLNNSAGTHVFERLNVGTPGNPSPDQAIEIFGCIGTFTFENFDIIAVRDGLTITGGNPAVNVLTTGTVGNIHSTQVRGILNFAGSLNGTFTNVTVGSMATPASGPGIQILGGGGGTVNFEDIDIHVNSGVRPGIEINQHDVNFDSASDINVSTQNIRALILQNGAYNGQIDSVSMTGSDNGVQLLNQTGTIELGLVNINSTGLPAFEATNAGTITVTNPASSLATDDHSTIIIDGATIGAGNMTFNTVTNTDSTLSLDGININNLSGATLQIASVNLNNAANGRAGLDVQNSSASLQVDAGTIQVAGNPGINLVNNTGIFNFAGLGITGTTQPGVNMTGGGTIQFTGTNTITTTTGSAINISDSTIGASGITFESINTNGASRGIELFNTGTLGGLSVTGTGAADSGGTIDNSNEGLFLAHTTSANLTDMRILNSTVNHLFALNVNGLTLNRMNFVNSGNSGIEANSLTALHMTQSTMDQSGDAVIEAAILVTNLLGTSTITSSNFTNSSGHHIRLQNSLSTQAAPMAPADILTLDNNSFFTPMSITLDENIFVRSTGTGNFRFVMDDTIGQNTIEGGHTALDVSPNGATAALELFVDNIDISNMTGGGIDTTSLNGGTFSADILNSSITNYILNGISLGHGFGGNTTVNVTGNTITTSAAGRGIDIISAGSGTGIIHVADNTISATSLEGIFANALFGSSTMNLTLDNNSVDNSAAAASMPGINVTAGIGNAADLNTICLNMLNNTSVAMGQPGFALIRNGAGPPTFNLQDFVGNGSLPADIITWINTTKGNTGTALSSGAGFTASGGACPVP